SNDQFFNLGSVRHVGPAENPSEHRRRKVKRRQPKRTREIGSPRTQVQARNGDGNDQQQEPYDHESGIGPASPISTCAPEPPATEIDDSPAPGRRAYNQWLRTVLSPYPGPSHSCVKDHRRRL